MTKLKSPESVVQSPETEKRINGQAYCDRHKDETPNSKHQTPSGGPIIQFPTEDEERELIADSLRRMRINHAEFRLAAVNAREALPRLIEVMRGRSGQSYKLRALLYSIWSGTPGADLSDVVCFDWEIRKDLCRFILGWGFSGGGELEFFYKALEAALEKAGLAEWFREAGGKEAV